MRARTGGLLVLMLAAPAPHDAWAAWPNSPFLNLHIAPGPLTRTSPQLVSDGDGGAIFTWSESGGSTDYDIRAQHVGVTGGLDPNWPSAGQAICSAPGSQGGARIATDGLGGAIITWSDWRGGLPSIYAQHVLATGDVDPGWPADGRPVTSGANHDVEPRIVADGMGGAVIVWRRVAGDGRLFAQRILASGVVDPAWPSDGLAVCVASTDQLGHELISDQAGGAIIAWYDHRTGTADVYAQRVTPGGSIASGWPTNGRAVCTAAGHQTVPQLASDCAGGAIVTWNDDRDGNPDVFAQHVLSSGGIASAWPVNGRRLCASVYTQSSPVVVSDDQGGAIVAWQDDRNGVDFDIYTQRVLASGFIDPEWPEGGRPLTAAQSSQWMPRIAPDGVGGAVVAWQDHRVGQADVYALRVRLNGTVDPAWPVDGAAVCAAEHNQFPPSIIADGSGGAIHVWEDRRTGSSDVYAQRVGRYGYLGTPEPEITAVADVPNDQGGSVKVSWTASYLEAEAYSLVTHYNVFRSVPPSLVAEMRDAGVRTVSVASADAMSAPRPGELVETVSSGTTYAWEFLATVNRYYLPSYSYIAPTAQDSTIAGGPPTTFLVQAWTAGNLHWESQARGGHSLDNLAPAAPASFTGQYAGGATHLHWSPNAEDDLAGYRLYRGTSAGFVPGPEDLVAALPDTGYADDGPAGRFYKLAAVDVHGNESPVALLSPSGTVAVEGGAVPAALSLAAPWPNPADSRTTLRYTLPFAGHARLAVFDAAGRVVRELAAGTLEAGVHAADWDLRDDEGSPVRPGLYFARLELGGAAKVRRVAVTR